MSQTMNEILVFIPFGAFMFTFPPNKGYYAIYFKKVKLFSGSFGRLLRCFCLTGRPQRTTVRLRAAAGKRLVLTRNPLLKRKRIQR